MKASHLLDILHKQGIEFFAGVPDSQLKCFCDCLMEQEGLSIHHTITPNEGLAVAVAAGDYLATQHIPCVYLQNSGLGNIVNPVASLTHPKVYSIPMMFVIGWRGEPGVKDEPQHVFQGEITLQTLDMLGIEYMILSKDMGDAAFEQKFSALFEETKKGKSVAIVVQKNALSNVSNLKYRNDNELDREKAIEEIIAQIDVNTLVVSSTGKISRELFEIRERNGQGHQLDFLSVGSMGCASSLAYQIARRHPERAVVCLDGDGAVLMQLGAMSMIGAAPTNNLVHIVLDNHAHDTVGGMPTVSAATDICSIAKSCGYGWCSTVDTIDTLKNSLRYAMKSKTLCVLRVLIALGARDDLGRPTITPIQNRDDFINNIREGS